MTTPWADDCGHAMIRHDRPAHEYEEWTSSGLPRGEALDQWRYWAASTIAPIEVTVFDVDQFAARWISHGLGQLRLLKLRAPAQRVVRTEPDRDGARVTPSIQLIYAQHGTIRSTMEGRRFLLEPGQFVLLDNTRFYQMDMATEHQILDLMMPQAWLERYVPDLGGALARPLDAAQGWGAPLGALLDCLGERLTKSPLPRSLLAEQVGSLLALATGGDQALDAGATPTRHRGRLVRQIFAIIERDYGDPHLSIDQVAGRCGISKSYVQALLRENATSFVVELNAYRLDRASDMLADPRAIALSIGEVAFRSGILDASYFTRLFRKRFGMSPGAWRAHQSRRPEPARN